MFTYESDKFDRADRAFEHRYEVVAMQLISVPLQSFELNSGQSCAGTVKLLEKLKKPSRFFFR